MSKSKKHRITGEEAWQQAFEAVDHTPLLAAFGLDLEPEELRLALTHRSFANENGNLPNNERLEFLGDAVLGLSVAGSLYALFPSRPESDISKMRASIVSRYGLADIAREINLGQHLLLGHGELVTGGREKESILADTTEALLGAFYLHHGFEPTRDAILRLFKDKLHNATAKGRYQDWKTTLQERVAELKCEMPEYVTTSTGPDHAQTFTSHVRAGSVMLGQGEGGNKKVAEQEAARQAYLTLQEHPEIVAPRTAGQYH